MPEAARSCLALLVEGLRHLQEQIGALDAEISARAKADDTTRRLMTVPGIGPLIATAIEALAPPAETFQSGRTPVQRSTGGKERLGRTSRMGERTLRRLLIIAASAVVRWAKRKGVPKGSWLGRMLERKPPMLVDRRPGEQECPYRLGTVDKGRKLPSSGRIRLNGTDVRP